MHRMLIALSLGAVLFLVSHTATSQPAVVSFTLIDSHSNQPIPDHDPLADGAVIDPQALSVRSFNVRANTSPEIVGSVLFGLDDNFNYRMENAAPYALEGDLDGDYKPWFPAPGAHTLTAAACTGENGTGERSDPLAVRFTVAANATPVPGVPPVGAEGPLHTFIEEEGRVIVEVESAASDGDWKAETGIAGYTGDFYYTWRGPDLFGQPGVGVLTYRIQISEEGTYHLRIRNYHDNPDGTQSNDCWVKMDDGAWTKVWSPAVGQWNWISHFDFSEHNKPPASYELSAGTHTFQIAGRSADFSIDRFHFHTGAASDPLNERHPQSPSLDGAEVSGELKQWHRVTLTFDGPAADEGGAYNPFPNYRMSVTFTNGDRTVRVPGFFAADGAAAESGATKGNKWRAHFTPDRAGVWSWRAAFQRGTDLAVSGDAAAGDPIAFHGASGAIKIGPSDKTGDDFRGKGLLQYAGGHHLRFAGTGEYYLKGGADSPENLLGYADFDGTSDMGGIIKDFLHKYEPHVKDWKQGDPAWRGGKGKGLIGGLNYLNSMGVNSVYFLTYNLDGGDGQDTWPWTSPEERYRFDCSKLDQWEIVFSHMDKLGIQLHVVLQEEENDQALDGGDLGSVRKLYFREMVARFAHHPALIWNLGEENTNTPEQREAFAKYIRDLDPYDHPITFHSHINQADAFYDTALGKPHFEATSIQGDAARYGHWARTLRQRSKAAGRPWVIYGDEQNPAVEKHLSNLDELRRNALWGNLMGGGSGVEWYFGYQDDFGDMQSEDWRRVEPLWKQTKIALDIFREYLPFWEMEPVEGLVSKGEAWVLAKAGKVYAVYAPSGGNLTINMPAGKYLALWFNPRTGEKHSEPANPVRGPESNTFSPPSEPSADWLLLLDARRLFEETKE